MNTHKGWIVTDADQSWYLGTTYDDAELEQYASILTTLFDWHFTITADQIDARQTEHNQWTTFRRVWNTR